MNVRRETYNKVQEFLEDIYIYLNNVTCSEDEDEPKRRKLRELIENCKRMRALVEAEFHPHEEDDVDATSYLDMNRSRAEPSSNDQNSTEEYVNVTNSNRMVEENTYDIYDASPPLDGSKCPYTGLPAAHLKLMNSPQVGLLTRVGKKMFFAQEKDFYAGILGKWILLYPSKSNDMKPSEYFNPVACELERGEHHFSVVTEKRKKFVFHAPNREEYEGWMEAIRSVIDNESTSCQLREKDPMTAQFRKLPSPPLQDITDDRQGDDGANDRVSSENYYGFNRSSNQTVIDADAVDEESDEEEEEERLYEEPTRSAVHVRHVEEQQTTEAEIDDPPTLPLKTGRKTLDSSETHSYDVPRPAKSIESEAASLHANEQQSRSRVSEMTAILATSMSLVSPEELRKSTTPTKKVPNVLTESQDQIQHKRVSPMKVWFTKHIKIRRRRREMTPEVDEEGGQSEEAASKIITVNSIVNMFEKNGHFKNLSKNLKFKDEDFEPVCVKV